MMAEEISKILPENYFMFPLDTHFLFSKSGRPHQIYVKYDPKSKFNAADYWAQAEKKFRQLISQSLDSNFQL